MTLPQACAEIQQRADALNSPNQDYTQRVQWAFADRITLLGFVAELQARITGMEKQATAMRATNTALAERVAELQAENKRLAEAVAAEREQTLADIREMQGELAEARQIHYLRGNMDSVDRLDARVLALDNLAAAIRTRAAAQSDKEKP